MRELLEVVTRLYTSGHDYLYTNNWHVSYVSRGKNRLIYRIKHTGTGHIDSDYSDLAAKITENDERDRAWRAYTATTALFEAGHSICPKPIMFEREPPGMPGKCLFVSTWLPGEALDSAPAPYDKRSWRDILYALSHAHKLNPAKTQLQIRDAAMPVRSPGNLLATIQAQREQLPDGSVGGLNSTQIDHLLSTLRESVPFEWEKRSPVGLILGDPCLTNMINYNSSIRLVDWEYSGWADPAFEIGALCAQPLNFDLPDSHRTWIRAEHERIMMDDPTSATRAEVYERMMNVFWVLKLSIMLVTHDLSDLEGVGRSSLDYVAAMQMRYWERTCEMLGMVF